MLTEIPRSSSHLSFAVGSKFETWLTPILIALREHICVPESILINDPYNNTFFYKKKKFQGPLLPPVLIHIHYSKQRMDLPITELMDAVFGHFLQTST